MRLGHRRVFALSVAGYTAGRTWIELMRVDQAHHILGMRVNAWVSILVFIGAVAYVIWACCLGEREVLATRLKKSQPTQRLATSHPSTKTKLGTRTRMSRPRRKKNRPASPRPAPPSPTRTTTSLTELPAVAALATHCVRLPLALRTAAQLGATRCTEPVAELVAEFADPQHRPDLLDAGAAIRTARGQHGVLLVLPASSGASAQLFRLLGLHSRPGHHPCRLSPRSPAPSCARPASMSPSWCTPTFLRKRGETATAARLRRPAGP